MATDRVSGREEAETILKVHRVCCLARKCFPCQPSLIFPCVGCLQATLEEGETWNLVEAKWFEQWAAYTGCDVDRKQINEPRGARPGPIDNSPLQCRGFA